MRDHLAEVERSLSRYLSAAARLYARSAGGASSAGGIDFRLKNVNEGERWGAFYGKNFSFDALSLTARSSFDSFDASCL